VRPTWAHAGRKEIDGSREATAMTDANIVPVPDRGLITLEEGCRLLAEARQVEVVVDVRDRAQATLHYYRQRRDYGSRAMLDAAEIKLRAERKLGELFSEMPVHPGGRPPRNPLHHVTGLPPTRQDLGVTRRDVHHWRRLAAVPVEPFESHVAEVRDAGKELTTAGLLRLAKHAGQPGKQDSPPLADGCTVDDLQTLIDAGKTFGTVYADPPWPYDNQATRASTDNHYRTMPVDEIAALPVKDLATDLAHLHLWTTNAFLPDALRILEAWDFRYKGAFVWCKRKMGIGNYWRVSHEYLLLGVRGTCRFAKDARNLMSWGLFDCGEHSAKPERVRHMIEKASPGPRLELFARWATKGWTVWGNEIKRDLFTREMAAR
jgi:N6-adenosine-specific RNA methylase IME4